MNNITQVAEVIQTVLTTNIDNIARETGFVQRSSKLTGRVFVQATVFGWLANPCAPLSALAQDIAALGVHITPQGLDQRFTRQAAAFLKRILNAVVAQVIAVDPGTIPLLQRFTSVVVQDSSTITLPSELSEVWSAGGGSPQKDNAAIKLQVRVDLLNGTLTGPLLQDGCRHDHSSPFQAMPLPSGALWLADLGYFSLDVLRDLDVRGAFFLSRLQVQTVIFDSTGNRLDLLRLLQTANEIDIPVSIGLTHRLSVRLLAVRVAEGVANERRRKLKAEARHKGQKVSKARIDLADWTILITNAPAALISVSEALVLARVRWQIELMFKLWKQHGRIDEWRSDKPWRILSELYAKLIAMIIQHWLLLVGCWAYPNRSLVKAAQTIRSYAQMLLCAMASIIEMTTVIEHIHNCLASTGCRMNHRKTKPNTYQLLLELPNAA